jgi:hypothetical protein
VAFGAVGVLALILRWAYRRGGSLVMRPVRRGLPTDYGLLVPVAAPRSVADGEALHQRLTEAGVRATVAETEDGPRVLVFPDDEDRARALLAAP